MAHYFTDNTNLAQNRKEISFRFSGVIFKFITDNGVFSKSEVDFGTWVLLKTITPLIKEGRVLDLGCGYGVVGVVVKTLCKDTQLLSVDVNGRAVELAKLNYQLNKVDGECLVSNVYSNVDPSLRFKHIITNPPIRAGKSVIYEMFEKAYEYLDKDGVLWVVIRKQQGAPSAIKKITEIFNNCEIIAKEKGYYVLKAQK